MSKEKTEYRFSVHAAPAVINQVIQNYLAANQYVQMPKPNANYYFFNDPWMKGKRSRILHSWNRSDCAGIYGNF